MDKKLNLKAKTIKLLEENIRIKLHDLDLVLKFLGYDTKSTVNKRKILSIGLHQNKKLVCMEGHTLRVKREPMEWEKLFADVTSEK